MEGATSRLAAALGDLTLAQVAEGLADGNWEPTDEVMGPSDTNWVPIESHPQLAEIAADLEPPPPRVYDDETHLDLNALIDVCLVLLIFFILTTSYAVLQKRLEAPGVTADRVGPAIVTKEKVDQQMIHVIVKMENGKPVDERGGPSRRSVSAGVRTAAFRQVHDQDATAVGARRRCAAGRRGGGAGRRQGRRDGKGQSRRAGQVEAITLVRKGRYCDR